MDAEPRSARPRRLLILVNHLDFFLSHRLPLAVAASRDGWEVHVAAAPESEPRTLPSCLTYHPLPVSRSGIGPLGEFRTFLATIRLLRRVRPSVVHTVTAKAVVHGGLAARAAGVPAVLAAMPGLGHVFVSSGLRLRLVRAVTIRLYKAAMGHPNSKVIVQNPDDLRVLREAGVISLRQAVLIRGSGVDLVRFSMAPEPSGVPMVLMASRLLREKGVLEFIEAARVVREAMDCRFVLAGWIDPGNPSSLREEELEAANGGGAVEWIGRRGDMPSQLTRANLFVLPSYYGEGVPKVLLEAAATGRAIVTTDMPGCREAVTHGENGLLVPPRDSRALADAIVTLLKDGELRRSMGERGRERAVREFSLGAVVRQHLQIYDSLVLRTKPTSAAPSALSSRGGRK